jgi:hypothetical protein
MNSERFLVRCSLWALLLCVFSCHGSKLTGLACKQDSDCGSPASAWRCETTTGVCYCRTDAACLATEFCNAVGYCQDRAGCQTDQDCGDPSLFCDTTTGTCLPVGRCALDIQCPLGQICDPTTSVCVPGCRSNGDCAGISCQCPDGGACVCTATDQADRDNCQVGTCNPYFCASEAYCEYGQQCGLIADSGIPYPQCYSDYDPNLRPYCATCSCVTGDPTCCGEPTNYCLIDTTHTGVFYCGTDCSAGQTCPHGYACQDVIVVGLPGTTSCVPSTPAGGNIPGICPPNPTFPCTSDSDCPFAGYCKLAAGQDAGFCGGLCSSGENTEEGFCTCLTDSDCPAESCNGNVCNISGRPCIQASDCHFIHCVDFQGAGGCWIGENCAPADGLTCFEVGSGAP